MDPFTAATAFATIVQLLAIYKRELGEKPIADYRQFISWLEDHRLDQIKDRICNSPAIQDQVNILLRQDHAVILEKLDEIGVTLATLLSRVDEFRGLAATMVPSVEISEQAISILRQLVNSKSQFFCRMQWVGGVSFHLEMGGQIKYTEPRFVEDDIDKLVSLGLLSLDYASNGAPIYRMTRETAKMIALIDGTFRQPCAVAEKR